MITYYYVLTINDNFYSFSMIDHYGYTFMICIVLSMSVYTMHNVHYNIRDIKLKSIYIY